MVPESSAEICGGERHVGHTVSVPTVALFLFSAT